MRIGIISDTHGYLDDVILNHFSDCDEIWHIGDFGTVEVSDKLAEKCTLRGVYGNIDGSKIRAIHPLNNRFICEGVDVWMTHIGGYPGRYDMKIRSEIYANPPKLFLSGHSHILKVINDKKTGLLHINPGAAGKVGFHQIRTIVKMDINNTKFSNLQVIELGIRA